MTMRVLGILKKLSSLALLPSSPIRQEVYYSKGPQCTHPQWLRGKTLLSQQMQAVCHLGLSVSIEYIATHLLYL